MSRQELKESFEGLLVIIILSGIFLIIGSLSALVIGTWLNPSWIGQGLITISPLLIVGFIIVGVFGKLWEILN